MSEGYSPNAYDQCVFNSDNTTICTYVDDLFITSDNSESLERAISDIAEAYKDITVRRGEVDIRMDDGIHITPSTFKI
jgi:hypothetical protein